jgi:hypothetical protein
VPFTFLAHQAPVIPLKMLLPRWFSGAGLAIGSMAPDFEKFIGGSAAGRYGHSLVGQLTFCLPLSLLVYWLATRVVAEPLARYLPDLGPLRLRDYPVALSAGRRPPWATLVVSILLGSASHVAFDGFTHADPRVVALFPFLAARSVVVAGRAVWLLPLLQLFATVLGAAGALVLMLLIARGRRALAWAGLPPTAVRHRADARGAIRYWGWAAAATLLSSGASAVVETLVAPWSGARTVAFWVMIRLPLSGFIGLCVAGAVTRLGGDTGGGAASRAARPRSESRVRGSSPSRTRFG